MRYAYAPDGTVHELLASDADLSVFHPDYVANLHEVSDLVREGWISKGGAFVPPPEPERPSPPAFTRIAKADLWRRLTDEEAEALDAALQVAPARLRRIYEAASYLDTNDDDYPALRAGIVAALGEARADEVLAPTY